LVELIPIDQLTERDFGIGVGDDHVRSISSPDVSSTPITFLPSTIIRFTRDCSLIAPPDRLSARQKRAAA